MGIYDNQIQATASYYDPQMRTIEQNGGETLSSAVSGSDQQVVEWADVLRDLDAYY